MTIKPALLLIMLLVSFYPVYSQVDTTETFTEQEIVKKREKKNRGYLGFSLGPAFPVGNFGSNNWDDNKSGFATRGYQFTAIDFGYKITPNFGIRAAFKGSNLAMDVQEIANNYAAEFGGEFTVSSKRWNFGGLYFGPAVCIPTKIVDVDFKFMTGLMLAFAPEINISRGQEYVQQESAVGPSFSITLGTTARWHISKWMDVSTGIEFLSARPNFIIEYSSNNSFETETVFQEISVVNLSFGLALRIF